MHKFFVSPEDFNNDRAYIKGDDVKHIYKVLRLNIGDKVNINNCSGEEYLGQILEIRKDIVTINIIEKLEVFNESPINVYLYQGLPKSSKMDLIVQKATELGVIKVTPVITQRVVAKNELSEFKKLDRWKRIAQESCKQCKRSIIPEVSVPIDFNNMIDEIKSMDLIVVPYENEDNYGIKKLSQDINNNHVKNVAVIIGPEGGFEESEITDLVGLNSKIITLGPRILRTETAGFVAVSLIMYELGDLGGIY